MLTNQQVVLITGGASGIGLALAQRFAQANHRVIITGRDPEKLAIAQANTPVLEAVVADMTKPADIANLATRYPEVTILINNAAVQYNYSFTDQQIDPALIAGEIATNLTGPLLLIKQILPHLLSKPAAAIINITSGLGFVPKQEAAAYCGSKAGLHIATRALRWQLEGSNVRVVEVIPPLVDTPMTKGRGQQKITTAVLVEQFWQEFGRGRDQIAIGRAQQLLLLQRFFPRAADRIMRHGL